MVVWIPRNSPGSRTKRTYPATVCARWTRGRSPTPATRGNTILADTTAPTAGFHPLHHALHLVLKQMTPRHSDGVYGRLFRVALKTVITRHRPGVRSADLTDTTALTVCLECATLGPPLNSPHTAWSDEVYPCATVRGIVVSLWLAIPFLPAETTATFREGIAAAMAYDENIGHWQQEAHDVD